jgi:hypothetical protein
MPAQATVNPGFQLRWDIALAKEWPTIRHAAAGAGADDEADDFTQEIFLRLSAFPGRGPAQLTTTTTLMAEPRQLRAYCWRAAVNYVYQVQRDRSKQPSIVSLDACDCDGRSVEVADSRPRIDQELLEAQRKPEGERCRPAVNGKAAKVLNGLLSGRGGNLGRILVEIGTGLGRCQSAAETLHWILCFTHSQEIPAGGPHMRRMQIAELILAEMGDSKDLPPAGRKLIRNRLDKSSGRLKEAADVLCIEIFGSVPSYGRREYGTCA